MLFKNSYKSIVGFPESVLICKSLRKLGVSDVIGFLLLNTTVFSHSKSDSLNTNIRSFLSIIRLLSHHFRESQCPIVIQKNKERQLIFITKKTI